jgi:cell division protein FtsL
VVEFYTVKRIDNSRLRRRRSGSFVKLCGKQLAVAAVVAVALLAYTWQRYECLEMSFQLEQTSQEQRQALEFNRELRVELATLRSPARIDQLARNQLGMMVPQPAQIITIQPQTAGEMADASTATNPVSFR